MGYGEIDGEFVRILQQPIVDFAQSTPLTSEERREYMQSLGFEPLNDASTQIEKHHLPPVKHALKRHGTLLMMLLPTKVVTILQTRKRQTKFFRNRIAMRVAQATGR